MSDTKVYGPAVKRFRRWRVRTSFRDGRWSATYRHFDGSSTVSGLDTKGEAIEDLRHFVTMRVQYADGRWTEVPS